MSHCPPRRPVAISVLTLALVFSFPLGAINRALAAQDPAPAMRLAQGAATADSAAAGAPAPAVPAATETEPAVSSALLPNTTTGEGLQATSPDEPHDGMGHLPGHAAVSEADATDNEEEDPHHGMMHHHHIRMDDPEAEDPHEGMMMGDVHHGMLPHGSMGDGDHCSSAMHAGMMDPHHVDAHHGMQGWGMHGHHDGGGEDVDALALAAPAPPGWLDGLELSEEQEDKIFAILHEFAPLQRKTARLLAKDRSKLHHIGMATDYTEAETHKLSDEYGRALAESSLQSARMERRILDVLTPEQRRDAAHQAARGED